MGYVVNIAKDLHLFDDDLEKRISAGKDKRDYYAHRFFKESFVGKRIGVNIIISRTTKAGVSFFRDLRHLSFHECYAC